MERLRSWFGSKAGASSSSSAAAPVGGHESTTSPSSSSVAAAGGGRPSGSTDRRTSPTTWSEVMTTTTSAAAAATAAGTTTATGNITAPMSLTTGPCPSQDSSATSPVDNTAARDTDAAGKSQASTKHRLEVASPVTDEATRAGLRRRKKGTPIGINQLKSRIFKSLSPKKGKNKSGQLKSQSPACTSIKKKLSWETDGGDDDRNKENATSVKSSITTTPTTASPFTTITDNVGTLLIMDKEDSNSSTTNHAQSSSASKGNEYNTPTIIAATAAAMDSTTTPAIVPPVVTVCPSVGTNQGNNNNATNPPSLSAMSDTGSSGCNRNGENTNKKVHAGSNLESIEIEEEQDQDQEQDDAVEEEKEDDDESVPVNNDGDDDLFIKSGSDDATRGNNSEIDDAGGYGQGERGNSPPTSSNHDNEMTPDYSGNPLGDDGGTDNSGDFLDDDDDDDNHDSKRTTENSGDSLGEDGDDNNRTESKAKPIGSRPIAASTNTDDPDSHEIFTAASPDGTVPNSDASMVTDNTQHEADRQLDMASQSLESGTTRNMRTRSVTELEDGVEPVCRLLIKSYMIGDPRQFSEKNLHRLDDDEHAKLLLSLVNLVRYQNNDGDPKMFQNIISSLQRKGVNDAHGIIISILDAISNASYKDTKDGNIVKAVADHPAMSKAEKIQVIKHIGKQQWDRKKTQVIYVPDQLNPPWCEHIIENNEKLYLINKMILRSPGNEFIAVTKSKRGISNYQVEGDTNIKTWDELKTQFRDHKMFLVILTSDSKFVRVLVNSSAGFRPMRQEQFESLFGKPDKYADLVRTCMADAAILALRYYGIKDDNGEDLSYETAREKCDLNGNGNNISIDTVREFLLLYGFTHSRELNQFKSHRKKGPKKNVFAETQGVYFVLVSYCAEDEDDWEASDDDRHVFLFSASDRFLVDAYGCMKFTLEEGQDKAKMKQVMKEFLGEDVKYTIRNVWRIKQIKNKLKNN